MRLSCCKICKLSERHQKIYLDKGAGVIVRMSLYNKLLFINTERNRSEHIPYLYSITYLIADALGDSSHSWARKV